MKVSHGGKICIDRYVEDKELMYDYFIVYNSLWELPWCIILTLWPDIYSIQPITAGGYNSQAEPSGVRSYLTNFPELKTKITYGVN